MFDPTDVLSLPKDPITAGGLINVDEEFLISGRAYRDRLRNWSPTCTR